MERYNQPYIEHQFTNPFRWAEGMKSWFEAHLSKSAKNVLNISKVQQDLYRWDSQKVTGVNSVTFFKNFVSGNAGMPGDNFTPPVDEHMGIIGISILEGVNAVINKTQWTNGVSNPDILQAKLSVVVNGDKRINSIPLTEAITGLTTRGVGFIPLLTWVAWEGNTNLQVIIEFPVPVVLANTNLRIGLEGFGFGA